MSGTDWTAERVLSALTLLVHKPVGIYLAHAGDRLPDRLIDFLHQHGEAMPRAAYRLAIRKRKSASADRSLVV